MVGLFYAVITSLCYSSEDIILYELSRNFHPTFVFFCCSFVAFLLCSTFAGIIQIRWFPVSLTQGLLVILYGGLACTSQMFISLAIFSIGPGAAVSLFFTLTIFTVIFSAIFHRHMPRVTDVLFAICSTTGVALIAFALDQQRERKEGFSVPTPYGITSAILAAMAYAASLVVGNEIGNYENSHSLINILSYSTLCLFISIVLCSFFGGWTLPKKVKDIASLASTGATTFGGMLFGYLAVCKERPSTVSVILTSEVLVTYVGQFIFFKFTFHWEILAGSLLILCSCIGIILSEDEATLDESAENDEQRVEDEHRPMLKWCSSTSLQLLGEWS